MGVRYALQPIEEDFPDGVDSDRHALVYDAQDYPSYLAITLHYTIGEGPGKTVSASVAVVIKKANVIAVAGDGPSWGDLCAIAFNSSDTDDVVQKLATTGWGRQLIWKRYRRHQSNIE